MLRITERPITKIFEHPGFELSGRDADIANLTTLRSFATIATKCVNEGIPMYIDKETYHAIMPMFSQHIIDLTFKLESSTASTQE